MKPIITKKSLINHATTLNIYLRFMLDFDSNIPNERELIALTNTMGGRHLALIGFKELDDLVKRLAVAAFYFMKKYPPRKGVTLNSLVVDLSKFQTIKKEEVGKYGVQIGWLRERIDLKNFLKINDFPYQTYFGFGAQKGGFTVDEVKLLRDSFVILNKAKVSFDLLVDIKLRYQKDTTIDDSKIRYLHFDSILYSRNSILSFFAFFECFVNSIGHNYFKLNEQNLLQKEVALLQGYKFNNTTNTRGGYMDLKSRIKKMEQLIKPNESTRLNQLFGQDPFLSIFTKYQELRNSAVHNSPLKENINLSCHEWLVNAEDFANKTLEACIIIWKRLVNEKSGPNYLHDLEYTKLMDEAIEHNNAVLKIYSKVNE